MRFKFWKSAPRFRSAERDAKADAERWAAIERPLRTAIAEAEQEKAGLNKRIEDAKNQLSMLVGNDPFEYMEREEGLEEKFTVPEHELISAEKRLRQISGHIAHLHRVLKELEQKNVSP